METKNKKFHFIAAGGVGMSALAKFLAENGAVVSGSDINESKYTHLLEKAGVKIHIGHSADLIEKDLIVVASSAIKNSNPEIVRSKELGIKIYHRSDILKMISDEFSMRKNSCFIGFSGTHGKTTTSGLSSYVLEKGGYEPSYVVGGIIPDINTNGKFGGKKFFCAELDESDGTIEKYSTDIAVINNLEEDHLDYYKNGFEDIAKTFNGYLNNKPEQKVIINVDDAGCKKFMNLYPEFNYITFGLNGADYTAENIKIEGLSSFFDIYKNGKFITDLHLTIPGKHNIYNALSVSAALIEAGVDINKIKEHFTSFSGMGRRFQWVGEIGRIKIYDDYAHHPSEIKTTLKSLKEAVKNNYRVVAVFQPHRYSRLQGLWNEFKHAFDDSDLLIVTDVFSAGEDVIDGINSENFVNELTGQNVKYINGDMKQAAEKVMPLLKDNDIVVTLGAGTITQLGRYLLQTERVK